MIEEDEDKLKLDQIEDNIEVDLVGADQRPIIVMVVDTPKISLIWNTTANMAVIMDIEVIVSIQLSRAEPAVNHKRQEEQAMARDPGGEQPGVATRCMTCLPTGQNSQYMLYCQLCANHLETSNDNAKIVHHANRISPTFCKYNNTVYMNLH